MLEKYLEDLKNKSVSSIRPKNRTEKLGIKEFESELKKPVKKLQEAKT